MFAEDPSSVRLARGQRPHPPPSGQPARPDHGAWALRSVPSGVPPWTFARRFGTVSWEGRRLCDGRGDDEVLGTCLQRARGDADPRDCARLRSNGIRTPRRLRARTAAVSPVRSGTGADDDPSSRRRPFHSPSRSHVQPPPLPVPRSATALRKRPRTDVRSAWSSASSESRLNRPAFSFDQFSVLADTGGVPVPY